MDPQQQNFNPAPNQSPNPTPNPPLAPTPTPAPKKRMTGRTKLALWLLIGPTALLIVTFILFAISNFIASIAAPVNTAPGELFPEQSTSSPFINIALFLVGSISVITWLPGLIVGIVLLASKPAQPPQPPQL